MSLTPWPLLEDNNQEGKDIAVDKLQRSLHPDMKDKNFAVIVAASWKWQEHINGLEMRSMYAAMTRPCPQSHPKAMPVTCEDRLDGQ